MGQESSSSGSHPCPSSVKTLPLFSMYQVLALLALKGNGKQHLDWFDLCSAQNTLMTNSESKYHLFGLHFMCPDYQLFK